MTDHINLATRPELRAGSDEFWDKAEAQMLSAARKAGVEPVIAEGDGAFYAPKLDFVIKDAIGREWTIGTIQLDYVLPDRLDAEYVGEDGGKHRPVMLHRAILGSLERFIGVLIEHYAGAFPMWLAPVQVVVATISEAATDYAKQAVSRTEGGRPARGARRPQREDQLQGPRAFAAEGPGDRGRRRQGGGGAQAGAAPVREPGATRLSLLDDAKKFLLEEALPPGPQAGEGGRVTA